MIISSYHGAIEFDISFNCDTWRAEEAQVDQVTRDSRQLVIADPIEGSGKKQSSNAKTHLISILKMVLTSLVVYSVGRRS